MFRLCFCISLSFLFLISCKKDDSSTQNIEEENFYALKVGNYWKYQHLMLDAQGAVSDTVAIEEAEIVEEISINNNSYFKFKITTQFHAQNCISCYNDPLVYISVRDSLGYLIDEYGKIMFSNENTDSYLVQENEWGDIYMKLNEGLISETVPAGTFEVYNNERFAIFPDETTSAGRDDYLFSPGIGWIKNTCSSVNTGTRLFEKVLIEYSLN